MQLAGEPFEIIENAMPFLNIPKELVIKAKVDTALNEMKADGTLSAISKKWFNSDITQ